MSLLDQPLLEAPLAFFDVETTGLSSRRGDRVCEIAVLRRDPGGKEEIFETLIDPGRPLSLSAFRVNRISREMLKDAPRFPAVAREIKRLLEGAVGVAHHARFDIGFLRNEFFLLGEAFSVPHCLDTLALARAFYRFPRNNLLEVARGLGVAVARAHRARADVETTRAVFERMAGELATQGLLTPRQIQERLKGAVRRRRRSGAGRGEPGYGEKAGSSGLPK